MLAFDLVACSDFAHRDGFVINLKILFVCIIVYITNQAFLKQAFSGNLFIVGYLNDIACMPAILAILDEASMPLGFSLGMATRRIIYLCITAVCAFAFEVLRPFVIESAVSDPNDVIAYFFGTIIYIFIRH